jgi:hypothetical protein
MFSKKYHRLFGGFLLILLNEMYHSEKHYSQ